MTKFKVFTLTVLLLLLSSPILHSQAITEYGKVVGETGRRQERANPKATDRLKRQGTSKGVVQGIGEVKTIPLPSALTIEGKEAALHSRHDEWSDKLIDLWPGEKLVPIAETTAGNGHWYMVKTPAGLVGWVKSTNIKKDNNAPGGQ